VTASVLLTDRSPDVALPALGAAGLEPKTDDLSVAAIDAVLALSPDLILVDAAENPGQGLVVLRALRERGAQTTVVAILERADLERFAWADVADEIMFPGAPAAEVRVRLAMLRRRAGSGDGSTIRLGPLVLDVDAYRVTIGARPLDLTFKEFEVLRFLASRPGRVFTRPTMLREVWGYDFYGGTRTVDVHVRRLRAKLGPEHEHLIETVRGVGYRAAEP
jgi:DNA-binding response OmpR family regulator